LSEFNSKSQIFAWNIPSFSTINFTQSYVHIITINNNKSGPKARELLANRRLDVSNSPPKFVSSLVNLAFMQKYKQTAKSHKSINKITLNTIREH
jgi:hypothetical protein